MARFARFVAPGAPHHITQRGNRQQQVFFGEADYRLYLRYLAEYAGREELAVAAYCLMPNHVHLVVVPRDEASLATVLAPLSTRYASCINRREGWAGHFWQSRYYSCVLDDAHFYHATRYVERNPVRAGLVERAEEWPWSSARSHVTGAADPVLSPGIELPEVEDWAAWLQAEQDPAEVAALRHACRTGLPAGPPEFVQEMEARAGRSLRPGPRGRPRKA